MILGNTCTRNCRFCAVGKNSTGEKLNLDLEEPGRIAGIVSRLGLNYVVVTSVSRDDLDDGGAEIFVKTIKMIRRIDKNIKIEVLIPDFNGKISNLKLVLGASPDIIGHNLETVKRLYKDVRPMADYRRSLQVLKIIKQVKPSLITKSSVMVGVGETAEEVFDAMRDLRDSDCDVLTLGQYLAPTAEHYPVKEFVDIGQFKMYEEIGFSLGFKAVLSGPLVRSSYQAETVFNKVSRCTI